MLKRLGYLRYGLGLYSHIAGDMLIIELPSSAMYDDVVEIVRANWQHFIKDDTILFISDVERYYGNLQVTVRCELMAS